MKKLLRIPLKTLPHILLNKMNIEFRQHNFFNYGYISTKLPKKLYDKLLKECLTAENNTACTTGLSSQGIPKHYFVEKCRDELIDFIRIAHQTYEKAFPNLSDIKMLSKDLPYKYEKPWINVQKEHEFIPCHNHDGIFSYSIWMKIPYDSTKEKFSGNFNFMYLDILGRNRSEVFKLSKKDEGTLLMFPSKLLHIVYPFYNNKQTRFVISGNIVLDSNNELFK
jgi:hypothetical protein